MDALNGIGVAIEVAGIAGVAAASYASTNLDNFLVVSAYSAKSGYRPFFVKLTFVLVCLAVVLVSLGLASAADTFIADKLRYLGAIPIGIGLYQLGKLVFRRSGSDEGSPDEEPGRVGGWLYFGFALALMANSSDSVIVLAPLFADLKPALVVICAFAAIAVATAMSSVASLVGAHPLLRARVEKIADWALPFLLIGIGLMILLDKPADAFLEGGRSSGAVGAPSLAMTSGGGREQRALINRYLAPVCQPEAMMVFHTTL